MKNFWRFFVLLLCLLLPCSLLGSAVTVAVPTATAAALPPPKTAAPALSAASAILLAPQSGAVLHAHNADERRPMASTTKIMTALVVLEHCALDTVVTIPREAVGVEGSSIYLFEGEQITVRDLLYGLLLSSANDAAVALALHTAGSVPAFAALMNERAAELSLRDTHFENPHGLHSDGHYTTARELALITAEALKNPVFAEIVSTVRHTAKQNGTDATRLFLNHNKLLRSYEGAIGVKTGFTKASGRCLVSAAERDGLTLIAVTLNAPSDWRDHTALFDWGFSEYTVFSPTPPALTLPVVGGEAGEVALLPANTLSVMLPASHGEIGCIVELPHFLYAGFDEGKTVGRIIYTENGKAIGAVELKTAAGVKKEKQRRGFFEFLRNLFSK